MDCVDRLGRPVGLKSDVDRVLGLLPPHPARLDLTGSRPGPIRQSAVTTCPEWTVWHLLTDVGRGHRWTSRG